MSLTRSSDSDAIRVLATGEFFGFAFEVLSNAFGCRCGYVRIPRGHPWFGEHYDDIDVSVHGGLTFASHGTACDAYGEATEWWIGFDCAHHGDTPDPALFTDETRQQMAAYERIYAGGHIWTQDEVIAECRSLAEQAFAARPIVRSRRRRIVAAIVRRDKPR